MQSSNAVDREKNRASHLPAQRPVDLTGDVRSQSGILSLFDFKTKPPREEVSASGCELAEALTFEEIQKKGPRGAV